MVDRSGDKTDAVIQVSREREEGEDEEEEESSEFRVLPYETIRRDFLKRKHAHDDEFNTSRHDRGKAAMLSKRRRQCNDGMDIDDSSHYNPSVDPELYEQNCYLCFTKTHVAYPRFYGVLAQHLGSSKMETIVDMVYQVFDIYINPYTERKVDMTRARIKEHIFHHMHEPLIEYYVQMEQYKTTRDILYDLCFQCNGNGEHLIDYKAIATIEKLNAKVLALYKEKPSGALFADSELNLASGGAGG